MTDQTGPAQPTADSGSCCGSATSTEPETASVCCGTAQAAGQAGACCDPAAKTQAVAAGASCCGATATGPAETTDEAVTVPAPVPAPELAPAPWPDGDGLPVVVIGAGPVGLAAAAHLTERGLPFLVLDLSFAHAVE
jgi:hypothetical protein